MKLRHIRDNTLPRMQYIQLWAMQCHALRRLSNLEEGIFRGVFDLKNEYCGLHFGTISLQMRSVVCTSESSSATEKLPGSMQTRSSLVYGEFWPVLAAVRGPHAMPCHAVTGTTYTFYQKEKRKEQSKMATRISCQLPGIQHGVPLVPTTYQLVAADYCGCCLERCLHRTKCTVVVKPQSETRLTTGVLSE